jgi:glutathione S-transferase
LLSAGFIDHFPTDLVSANYPALKEHHARVASLPAVQAFYKDVTEGMRLAYKALP